MGSRTGQGGQAGARQLLTLPWALRVCPEEGRAPNTWNAPSPGPAPAPLPRLWTGGCVFRYLLPPSLRKAQPEVCQPEKCLGTRPPVGLPPITLFWEQRTPPWRQNMRSSENHRRKSDPSVPLCTRDLPRAMPS
ncbi:Hypothetical predicted protein [Marmota monax]|uniref:Uncharacterized protein n=1 Tax=Marmota monax TaxID=9995 RepID=A0A5E4BCC0_MARMO|nr:hypothetical protein GHT09_007007 [Marmota monax]VTJ67046.1 Hypothetical predicted protein [Marmota monax]